MPVDEQLAALTDAARVDGPGGRSGRRLAPAQAGSAALLAEREEAGARLAADREELGAGPPSGTRWRPP